MKRIQTIDFVRGLVMLIMAIDHIRDLMYISTGIPDPTDLSKTTVGLFFTRWITHLCAATFVFLSGTSVYFSFQKQQYIAESKRFLLTRGLWLIVLEFTVITFAIWFDIQFRTFLFQVIAAIGFSFIILAFLLKLPPKTIGIIGLIIIFGHNALQGISLGQNPVVSFIVSILFGGGLAQLPNTTMVIGYPIVPWLGIMLAGFGFGQFLEQPNRQKRLWQLSAGMIILFIVLRFLNIYGDPVKWSVQKDAVFTFLSFINITKYPPSLLYVLITLGISISVMAMTEGVKNKFIDIVTVYGKVPLFYYLIHWYSIRFLTIALMYLQGYSWKDFVFGTFEFGKPKGPSGVELPMIYAIWFGLIVALYPLCKWYGAYKLAHPEKKWLRYL
ncbi:MAG: heparan-alpha-glucosaminide N-acetyltransferase domain-containing protein [Bacteroidota bacterium]